MKTENLKREFFSFDVKIHDGLAKWENHKHPDNPNFMQPVFWAAHEANGNLIVRFYLDKTAIGKNHIHAVVPMNGQTFEDAVFNYWQSN